MSMKRNLYLNSNGSLKRKESTIYYFTAEGRRILPVEQIKAIYAVGRINVTSGVMSFLARQGIPLHFFGYYGNYEGSFYPRRRLISGYAVLKQAAAHLDQGQRLHIARCMVEACISNMAWAVRDYRGRVDGIDKVLGDLSGLIPEVRAAGTVSVLLSVEGRAWNTYYDAFNMVIKDFKMGPRVKRPPNNPVNALISLGNTLLYSAVLTQLYHTQLDPSISFLHEPLERRFSLSLDIAEMFKPEFVDRLIFRVLNLQQLREEHFDQDLNYCILNEEGRKVFLNEFDGVLRKTRRHPRLRRSVSNEMLLRLDCYKLLKHVVEGRPYQPYQSTRGW